MISSDIKRLRDNFASASLLAQRIQASCMAGISNRTPADVQRAFAAADRAEAMLRRAVAAEAMLRRAAA